MVDSRTLAYTFLERSTRRYYCVSSFRSDICGSMLSVSSKMIPGTNYFRSKGWTAYMVMRCLRLLLQPGVMRTQALFQIRRHLLKLETPPHRLEDDVQIRFARSVQGSRWATR